MHNRQRSVNRRETTTTLLQRTETRRLLTGNNVTQKMTNEQFEECARKRAELAQERMRLFDKMEITAKSVQIEIESIFDKLQNRVKNRITESSIEYYRRKELKKVKLLQDDESLRYIFEQLSRYITFHPSAAKMECSFTLLRQILSEEKGFRKNYEIDQETIPHMVRDSEENIMKLFEHLRNLYEEAEFSMDHHKKSKMALEDALSIIIIYQRVFWVTREKIVDSADEYVVNQDIFCKFVDPSFSVDEPPDKWSNKTKAAANLYQSVLDIQQNFVTLGQVRQTIDLLISDLTVGMKAGELIRLINHIETQARKDAEKCRIARLEYMNRLKVSPGLGYKASSFRVSPKLLTGGGTTFENTLMEEVDELAEVEEDDMEEVQEEAVLHGTPNGVNTDNLRLIEEVIAEEDENGMHSGSGTPTPRAAGQEVTRLKAAASGAEKKMKKNPALKFQHIHGVKWNNFIAQIANNFHYDIKSRLIFTKLIQMESEEHMPFEHKEEDYVPTLLDVIIDNTNFDIRHATTPSPSPQGPPDNIPQDNMPTPKGEAKEEEEKEEEKRKEAKKLKHARLEVFDTMLSLTQYVSCIIYIYIRVF